MRRRIIAIFLAMLMVLGLSVSAFADIENNLPLPTPYTHIDYLQG